jgi:scyllo-inositol 2-dehydrogenase (NADP+)
MGSPGRIGVGLVGYGLAGRYFHAPFIAAVDGLDIAAVATTRPDRQAEARADHPAARIVGTVDELLAVPDVELVVVASPNLSHVPVAIQALAAGRHVVVDKPIGTSIPDAERLIEAAHASGRLLSVYQNRRWDGDFLTVRRLVEAGSLGPIDSLESRFEIRVPVADAWREAAEQGGGPHRDLGAHLVDQSLLLFGAVEQVYAQMHRRRPGSGIDDSVFVAIEHAGGERSLLWTSLIAAWGRPRFRVRGLEAEFVKDERDQQEARLLAGRGPTDPGFGDDAPEDWGRLYTVEGPPTPVPTERGDYSRYYELMRDAIRGHGAVPVDPADSVRGLRVLQAAERSAQTGTVVRMDGA